jgi:TusA-related sulfurtransferase
MEKVINEILDLKGVSCPQNTAKALLKLNSMNSGEIIEVIMDDGEPINNFLSSLDSAGFTVSQKKFGKDGSWHLKIRIN